MFIARNDNAASEDCLKLNVWARDVANVETKKKPVLVFFHGGRRYVTPRNTDSYLRLSCLGFQVAGPNSPFYNGQYLAGVEDVIVVTSRSVCCCVQVTVMPLISLIVIVLVFWLFRSSRS